MPFPQVASAGAARRRRGSLRSRSCAVSTRPLSTLLLALPWLGALVAGCSLDEGPANPASVLVQPVAKRVAVPGGDTQERRYLVDGVASDSEWASVPYAYIAVGPENGNQGGSFTLAMKAAHDSTRIYLLLQWPDGTADRLGPRLVWDPPRNLIPVGCDTLLVGCSWRLVDAEEDRLAVMWDMGEARDNSGSFRQRGCQVACHGNMHPLAGSVDLWHWRAARTNPVNFPLFGSFRVGFADDGYADGAGRRDDPGESFFRDNYRFVPCGDGTERVVPLRLADALDTNNQPATRDNDFMRPCEYVYERTGIAFGPCSRQNPCRQFEQEDILEWVDGDDLPAVLLTRPFNAAARESRHDVEARGRWDAVVSPGDILRKGTWTLEMSRLLQVANPEDIDFDLNSQQPYYLAIAIMNQSSSIHSGTPVIELRFRP